MSQIIRTFKNGTVATIRLKADDKSCVEPEWQYDRRTVHEDCQNLCLETRIGNGTMLMWLPKDMSHVRF